MDATGFSNLDQAKAKEREITGQKTNGPDPHHRPGRILTGARFIADHVPPVWLIDGIVQRSRLYACTSLTGHGSKTAAWLYNACMVHAGRMIGHLDVFKGNVLILAGENPSDLKARMIAMAKAYDLPLDQLPYVLPGSFPMIETGADTLKRDIVGLCVALALIVGDTASSFFPGDDENSNVQAGSYARTLRSFTEGEGEPAVVVLSHPTKGAELKNLLPRGGGAFLNELDGNLTLWAASQGEVSEMHWCGKIRGPDFSPFGYRLRTVPTGLTDEKDRPEITIIAEPMSEEAIADHSKQALANEDAVLMALRDNPDWSYAQIARHLGWVDDGGNPMKSRVQRAIAVLAADKLVTQSRHGAPWTLTDKGNEAVPQNATPQPGATPTKTTKPETKPPPTDATRQASIDRLAAMRDLDLDPIRKQEAAALGITVPTLNREIKQARFAAAAAAAKPTEAAAPPEPALSEAEIDAEIDRIAHLSDAAFLALDRQALAARLHCTRAELIAMRRGKRAARGKRRTKKPADKAPNDPARGRTGGRIGGNAGYGLRYGRILQIRNDDTARYDTQVIAVPPRFNPYRRAIRGGGSYPPSLRIVS